jgi:hypothetical protein
MTRCWMSAMSGVSWLRISAEEFGELCAGTGEVEGRGIEV